MRTRFRLILKILGADEILYIARTALFDKINQLIRAITILFGSYPVVAGPSYSNGRFARQNVLMGRRFGCVGILTLPCQWCE